MKQQINVTEIINNVNYKQIVKNEIDKIKEQRMNLPTLKDSRYKRNIVDTFEEKGNFNMSFFIENIESIWNKKSKLPFRERDFIKHICEISIHLFLNEEAKKTLNENKN